MSSPEDSAGDGRDKSEPTETTTGEPDHARYEGGSGPRLSPALIATLVTIPIMVIVGFITYAALKSSDQQQTPVDSYTAATSADAGRCATLMAALPESFEGFGTKQVDGDTATWKGSDGGDPVTVRCGVDRPSELAPSSDCRRSTVCSGSSPTRSRTVGRPMCVSITDYVALWVPVSGGNSSITDVSAAIGRVLPTGPLDFG